MSRPPRLSLALLALAFVLACQGDRTLTSTVGTPSAMISDGTHTSGNPRFFFLQPISDPGGDADFAGEPFNPSLLPAVEVCELSGDPLLADPAHPVSCVATVFEQATAQVSLADELYQLDWPTDASNGGAGLDLAKFYRILVFVETGGTLLGFADVNPVASGRELKEIRNRQTGQIVALLDGRTLPIKFRIEVGAGCFEILGPCAEEVINLANGGSVILATGDRVDIPAQNTDRSITVTLQLCDGIGVDAPTFGNCLTVTATPPLGDFRFSPAATVSLCSVIGSPELPAQPQRSLLTMYRRDDGDVFALPHADDFCEEPIGSAPDGLFRQLARALDRLFVPRPLHATVAVLDVGDAGDTDFFSDFQLVLSAQMEPLEGTSGQSAAGGSPVANPPGVRVTDRNGAPVAGATVRFDVTAGGGTLDPGSVVPCGSDAARSCVASNADGIAAVTSWTLGTPGANSARASGFGIAGPSDGGPFMPDNIDEAGQPIPSNMQQTVPVGTGEVIFAATAVATGPLFGEVITPGAAGSPRSGVPDMTILLAQCDVLPGEPGTCTPTGDFVTLTTDANGRFSTNVEIGLWQIRPLPESARYPGITPVAMTVEVPMVDPKGVGAQFTALIIDQQQPNIGIQQGIGIGGTLAQKLAQTVTAGVNGVVTQLDMPVWCSTGTGNDLTVVLTGVGETGAPDDNPLGASTLVPGATIPRPVGEAVPFRRLVLTTPIAVDAGQRYAVVLGSTGNCALGAQGPLGDSYEPGDGWFWHSTNNVWVRVSNIAGEPEPRRDYPFKVLVQ